MGLVPIAMSVRGVVALILGCVFIVGGEVAVAIWALAGWGGGLDKVSKAIGQETSSAELYRQTKRAVESLGKHALGDGRLVVEEGAVARDEDRGDQVGNSVGVARHLCKGSYHRSDHSAFFAVFVECRDSCYSEQAQFIQSSASLSIVTLFLNELAKYRSG